MEEGRDGVRRRGMEMRKGGREGGLPTKDKGHLCFWRREGEKLAQPVPVLSCCLCRPIPEEGAGL